MSNRYETRIGVIQPDITTHWLLSRMCYGATKIYNSAMWHSKQEWEQTGKIPSGYDLEKVVKDLYWHKQIPASASCLTAQIVGLSYRSWFSLRKRDKTARPPSFRRKEQLSPLGYRKGTYKETNIDLLHSDIALSLGSQLKKDFAYPNGRLSLNIRWNSPLPKEDYEIIFVEINPSNKNISKNEYFEIHVKMKLPEPEWKEDGQCMFVDLGIINPITSMTENGRVDIFKGSEILSNLRYWNKTISKISERVMKEQKKKYSPKIDWAHKKCNAQINQKLHAMINSFVDLCVEEDIKEVVIGDLKGIKKEKDGTGKKWRKKPSRKDLSKMKPDQNRGSAKATQKFMQFPLQRMVFIMEYKLARHCIRLIRQNERGTSTGRCFVCGKKYTTKKARIKRGLFKCDNCHNIINADINGAGNQRSRYLGKESGNGILEEGLSVTEPNIWHWCNDNKWKLAHIARGYVAFKPNFSISQQGISVKGTQEPFKSSGGITPPVEH